MLVSTAWAAHYAPPSQTSGGAVALSLILGVVALYFLLRLGIKWLRRRAGPLPGDGGNGGSGPPAS